jgi:leader peptidase (prepilin peptidase)/N-methyltransferase
LSGGQLAIDVALGVLGLVAGSTMSAIAYRVPRDLSWVRGRSMCTRCSAPLTARDLVPLFSFLSSRGRCRHCGAPIGARYFFVELLCAAWAILLYRHTGPELSYPLLAIWGFLLIALTLIDWDFQLLPDALTLPGTLIAIAVVLTWGPGAAREALLGVLAGSGVLALLGWLWIRIRKVEGMGGGDVKLAAMFGAVLGWKLTLLTLFVAALAGSIWGITLVARGQGSGRTALPFGSLLAPAAMVVFLWGTTWLDLYSRLIPSR